MTRRNINRQRGSIMLTTAVSLFVILGMLGLSIDLGRVYIAKSEAQAFADIESVAAVRHLNGKQKAHHDMADDDDGEIGRRVVGA